MKGNENILILAHVTHLSFFFLWIQTVEVDLHLLKSDTQSTTS